MTTTYSEVFPAAEPLGMPSGSPEAATDRPRVDAHARARLATTQRDGKILARVRRAGHTVAADFRTAWWTPASLPTVAHVWHNLTPDIERVPGKSDVLQGFWTAYNIFVALPAVLLATGLIGALSTAAWVLTNPARAGLAFVLTATAVAYTVFG
jgi:hypothetical protein